MTIYLNEHVIPRPAYLSGGNWRIDRLTDITVLMGKNGSGKSVLLRAWRDQMPKGVHYVVPERTGDMEYQPHYINEEFSGTQRMGTYNRNFVPEYRRRIVSRVQTYFMVRGNLRSEAKPAGDPSELELLLSSLIPEFTIELQVSNPPFALKRVATNQAVNQIDQLSSGEAQLFTIGLDILTIAAMWELEGRNQRIMLIDEPDAHIHPDLQARFADFLVRLIDRFSLQLVIATHSTSLMSALGQFGGLRASVVYVEKTLTEYKSRKFDEVTKELASCLGGHVLMGPLFGAPLLLVEGDDDYRIWSQVPRHHVINLAVIPCNGDEIKRYQLALERILTSLSEPSTHPAGFALLDSDKSAPQPSSSNPQRFIRFIQLGCHEAENLYLTDVVLHDIGHTWESACTRLITEAARFGDKAAQLAACRSWDRRTADVKSTIQEIAHILDPKGVAWTLRVGNAIGRVRPTGDLATYLGTETLDALWPLRG